MTFPADLGSPTGEIQSTIDQGETWETLPMPGIPLFDVHFKNDTVGYVVGQHALIMKYNPNVDG